MTIEDPGAQSGCAASGKPAVAFASRGVSEVVPVYKDFSLMSMHTNKCSSGLKHDRVPPRETETTRNGYHIERLRSDFPATADQPDDELKGYAEGTCDLILIFLVFISLCFKVLIWLFVVRPYVSFVPPNGHPLSPGQFVRSVSLVPSYGTRGSEDMYIVCTSHMMHMYSGWYVALHNDIHMGLMNSATFGSRKRVNNETT